MQSSFLYHYQNIGFQDIFGMLSSLVLLTALLFSLIHHQSPTKQVLSWCILWGVLFIPTPLLLHPLVFYFRGFWGDLSVATLLIASLSIFKLSILKKVKLLPEPKMLFSEHQKNTFYKLIAALGLVFYPLALGIGYFDPYQLGFQSSGIELILLACAFLFLWKKKLLVCQWLILSIVAFRIGLYESSNLFNILIDPFIWIYVLSIIIYQYLQNLFFQVKNTKT